MKISIVDDDPKWIERIQNEIMRYDKNKEMEIDVFVSGEEYLKRKKQYDISFIDIEMTGIDGFETISEARKYNPNGLYVILTTHVEMSRKGYKLFVVGDDDQSIYGWRGANVDNILTFEERYSDVKVHKLLVNFRSTQAIVETANSFIQNTIPVQRLSKEIKFDKNGNIQDLRKLWFATREEEAFWVANRIKSLIGTTYIEYNPDGTEKSRRGLTYSDFAVLIRGIHSKNSENRDVQFVNAMRELEIPVKTTGEGGIFDRPYAQCILQIMELLRNEHGVDRNSADQCFNEVVIPYLPSINAGETFPDNGIIHNHKCAGLSDTNLKRIRAVRANGGSRTGLPENLVLECHKRKDENGNIFSGHGDVYGVIIDYMEGWYEINL